MIGRLVTVKLYGHLGKRFGRIHRLAISTPGEAVRALGANFKDFRQYLSEHSAPGYRVITDLGAHRVDQLQDPICGRSVKIVPVVAGAGQGVGQFILGAVLFAVGTYTSIYGGSFIAQVGIAMMVGGVSQMLFSPPKHEPNNAPNNQPSYAFSGPVNTTAQGSPVPVCYGRLMVGSQVISGGLYAEQI